MDPLDRFLYTAKEYKRFADFFPATKKHELIDTYSEEDYVAIQTKLIILRKFGNKTEPIYIQKILTQAENMLPEKKNDIEAILQKYNHIEDNFEYILPDGTKQSIYATIEDVMYGKFLHADPCKIERLQMCDEIFRFPVIRRYVEALEEIVLNTYELLSEGTDDSKPLSKYVRAPVIFLGDKNIDTQGITNSPYWVNLYGKDISAEEAQGIVAENSLEDNFIIMLCELFTKEARDDHFSPQKLSTFVFPPTRQVWGDFSVAHNVLKAEQNPGFSSKVRYNDTHDMAYVSMYRNVEGPFVIDQPHILQDGMIFTLVKENKKAEWRIFQIGARADTYKETLSLTDSIKRHLRIKFKTKHIDNCRQKAKS